MSKRKISASVTEGAPTTASQAWQRLMESRLPIAEVIGWNEEGIWWNDTRGSTHLRTWEQVRQDLDRGIGK